MSNSDVKQYLYQGMVIQLQFYPDSYCCDAGWHWEVFKNGESMGDSSKSCPDSSLDKALSSAKNHIDWMLDIQSDKQPILVSGLS
jgi:hypothetical protein